LGGATRSESVRNGLAAIKSQMPDAGAICDFAKDNNKSPPSPFVIVIHDGARPFVTAELIGKTIESAFLHGSGIAAVPAVDTIKETDGIKITRTLPRSRLYHMQTPQAFRFAEIADAYEKVTEDCLDDSETYQKAGYIPRIVTGDYANIKLTTERDFLHAEWGISGSGPKTPPRIGAGFDIHRLVENRPLILGGVHIPFEKGLLGHSDADVLTHAVMDALLSAAGLPDIGVLFPDTDPAYKGADSMKLLQQVNEKIRKGFTVGNISAVVMAEKPKLASYIPDICKSVASALSIHPNQVNVSATTTETLGIVGSGKGMAASATCILTNSEQ